MKIMRKILCMCLMVILITGTMGCSKTKEVDNQGVVTINFWHGWSGSEAETLQEVIDDFNNEHPNIKVETLPATKTDKQLTAITGGNPPDVGYLIDYRISKLASVGSLTELGEYINKSEVIDSDNFVQDLWNLGNYDGKQYGIPYTMDSYMLYYNKDLLKEAGYDEPPKTISELLEYSKKLTKKDANGDYTQVGFISDVPWLDTLNWAFAFGGNFYDFDKHQVTCDAKPNIDALTFKIKSYESPYEAENIRKFKSGFGKYMSPNNPFFQNQLAMDVEGQWFTTFIEKYAPDLNYGIVPMPYPDGHEELARGGQLQGGMLYIPKGSKHHKEAFELIEYLKSDKAYIKFCAGKGSIPTTFSALKDPSFLEKAPNLKPFVDIIQDGTTQAFPSIPFAKEYGDELKLQEERVYALEISPEEAMKNVKEKIQPLADEWAKQLSKGE